MDSDSKPFELIKALCLAGFEVCLSGGDWPTVTIRSQENGDISFDYHGDSIETALPYAALLAYRWLTTTTDALRPFCEGLIPTAKPETEDE